MPARLRVPTMALVLFAAVAVEGRGRQLLEIDGVELRGDAQLVVSGGGTCNVLESDTSYEEKKANHGAPMDIWRLNISVHNGSGRWLDHLIAGFQIEAEWPDCTNWEIPEARRFAQPIEWANSNGHIQESGRNVVAPGRTLTHTKFFIVLRDDPEPQFENWSMDFDFAAAPPEAAETPIAAPQMSAEQDMLFWQSIMNSTNRADFEAYLRQFPDGAFRALAQNRLAALDGSGSDFPAANRFPAGTNPQADLDSRQTDQPFRPEPPPAVPAPEPLCRGQADENPCWIALATHPDCYTWNPNPQQNEIARWSGQCSDRRPDGLGTLDWIHDGGWQTSTGVFRGGRSHGHWTYRDSDGTSGEGSYSDGEEHGTWVFRFADGTAETREFVHGEAQQ